LIWKGKQRRDVGESAKIASSVGASVDVVVFLPSIISSPISFTFESRFSIEEVERGHSLARKNRLTFSPGWDILQTTFFNFLFYGFTNRAAG